MSFSALDNNLFVGSKRLRLGVRVQVTANDLLLDGVAGIYYQDSAYPQRDPTNSYWFTGIKMIDGDCVLMALRIKKKTFWDPTNG